MISLPSGDVPVWIAVATALAALASAVVVMLINMVRLSRTIRGIQEKQEVLIDDNSKLAVTLAASKSALPLERYRLAERNISVTGQAQLIHEGAPNGLDGTSPGTLSQTYVIAHVDLKNTGERPVDVLACLVSGKVMSDVAWPGLGRDGREVGWDTLAAAYWNGESQLLRGISTTGNMFASRGQLLRIDPEESESLLRLDAVEDASALLALKQINLLYKVFVVVLGHPVTFDAHGNRATSLQEQLALLPHQHFRRWRSIQYSLSNLNRFPFRLALQAIGDRYANDPLGRVTTQTGWRCFLLHHWDFEQLTGKQPVGAPDPYGTERQVRERQGDPMPTISEVSHYIRDKYDVYDQRKRTPEGLASARQYCVESLDAMLRAWHDLNEAIDWCHTAGNSFEMLIQQRHDAKDRWESLLGEEYVLSHWWGGDMGTLNELAPERYAMRTKYIVSTIRAPGA